MAMVKLQKESSNPACKFPAVNVSSPLEGEVLSYCAEPWLLQFRLFESENELLRP